MNRRPVSGFRENAEHLFASLDADYVPADKAAEWGSAGGLPSAPSQQQVVVQQPQRTIVDAETVVVAKVFDDAGYSYLDNMHRDNIADIDSAISNLKEEMIPGAHPKLVESYAQLLERRTSAINAYTEFLKTSRKAEIEERKMTIAEKKAGTGRFSNREQQGGGLTMSPQQLVELVRAIDTTRGTPLTEVQQPSDKPDRDFE